MDIEAKRNLYMAEGMRYMPRLLELADRNKYNSTYGCFDRSYWHYRTADFPSGMYQEAVLPLAIVHATPFANNTYYHNERIKEMAEAGVLFAARSSHEDGSCDDYFPYERAVGAAAFSLYACTEAYLLLGVDDGRMLEFFRRRGRYLAREGMRESGILCNHKALVALTLYNVFLAVGDPQFEEASSRALEELLALQDEEGWFPEYEGCDPGYLMFTIDFLAKLYVKSKAKEILQPAKRAIHFASHFVHPDGSYGGEYGSRNTFHFLPHGLELMAEQAPEATAMADRFLESVQKGTRSYVEDDRIFIHYVYNYLQAYRDFHFNRKAVPLPCESSCDRNFESAGLRVQSDGERFAVIATNKGGVAKIFSGGELVFSDCGLSGKLSDSTLFTSQIMHSSTQHINGDVLVIEGNLYEHREVVFAEWSFAAFRVFQMAIGRFLPANTVRRMLQKMAILKSERKLPVYYRKHFVGRVPHTIRYEFRLEDERTKIDHMAITTDATFIYVATSQSFQRGTLLPWIDLDETVCQLNENGTAVYEHRIL